MKKNPEFKKDLEQKVITSAVLTKALRDRVPCKNDENAFMEVISKQTRSATI
jgi:hypothetical protein